MMIVILRPSGMYGYMYREERDLDVLIRQYVCCRLVDENAITSFPSNFFDGNPILQRVYVCVCVCLYSVRFSRNG